MKNKKQFLIPEASFVEFNNQDIIVTSGGPWGEEATLEEIEKEGIH